MPPRLATLLALLLLPALLAVGCGGDESTTGPPASTRGEVEYETEPVPELALGLKRAWRASGDCALPAGASRGGCDVGAYRCVAAATERGTSVSCSRPGESVSFLVRR